MYAAAAVAAALVLAGRAHVAAQSGPIPLQLTTARAQAFVDAADRHLDYLPGEVLVKFKPGTAPAQQQAALTTLRSQPSRDDLRWVGDVAVLVDATQPDSQMLAAQLSAQPEVLYAEPNYLYHVTPRPESAERAITSDVRTNLIPSDPDYSLLQWNFSALRMDAAWNINPGGDPNLIVAIVDTGITTANQTFTFPLFTGTSIQNVSLPFAVSPDLSASRLVGPRDFVFAAPGGAVVDMDGHATHVGSTVAENTNDSVAVAGMAYRVKLMPVKVCLGYWDLMIQRAQAGITGFLPTSAGSCPDDAIASGIRYAADNGARVINLSLGGPGAAITLHDALTYAVGKGAFVSIAMGNEFENGNPTIYPAAYAQDIDGVMSVAAVGRSLNHAFYSSSGSYCEIAAPGGDSLDAGTSGEIWQVTLSATTSSPLLIVPRFDLYAERAFQGTSMAAPHVAGLAALLMSQMGAAATPAVVEAIIKKTALDRGPVGRDDQFGYGLIQPRAALLGFGIKK